VGTGRDVRVCALIAVVAVVACSSGSDETAVAPPALEQPSPPPASSPPAAINPPSPTPPSSSGGVSKPPTFGSCSDPIPAGAAMPPPLPLYAGTCPALAAAPDMTTILTSGNKRTFLVVRPQTIAPGEKLPLVFAWHWLNGSPGSMVSKFGLDLAAEQRRMIFVVPEAKGDLFYQWPMMTSHPQSRMDEEMTFFDDMLACVAAALPIQTHCISSIGGSAGALFTTQLADARSERLASFVSLSGGVGDPVRPWSPAKRALPALVLWGGDTDRFPKPDLYIFDFQVGSEALETALDAEKHFITECVHNCGHAQPPFDVPPPAPPGDPVFQFILDHPYWTAPGASPYIGAKLPKVFPSWCAAGKGSATPRTGTCPN
jgi:pimeloyl-ACP methyl ester carboxylesterase